MLTDANMTNHAVCRMQQRGMTKSTLSFVLEHADRYKFVGEGCLENWISRKHLKQLRQDGMPSQLVERSAGIAVIVADDGAIITVFHKTEGPETRKTSNTLLSIDPGRCGQTSETLL